MNADLKELMDKQFGKPTLKNPVVIRKRPTFESNLANSELYRMNESPRQETNYLIEAEERRLKHEVFQAGCEVVGTTANIGSNVCLLILGIMLLPLFWPAGVVMIIIGFCKL